MMISVLAIMMVSSKCLNGWREVHSLATRKPVNGARARPWYGPERAARLSVARAKLTPPSDGRFSLNAIGLDDWHLDAVEPASQIGDLYAEPGGTRDVLIYVHGFKQTFESAALDA